ncbi:DUF3097 domain-containing protein [Lysinibacter sp. HNR]|uniref:DUF3097 domain-containing protein n=1 Tax=Lysinibacter sp. HNR TaxID=3031408 RepID=UPI0024352FD1|nr:DUF3097 domain-containing protein [Lysinibacter sp. HNR]WGD36889.1 DUF3097 domain-containing protein [Lysinibacter sp. HNR]
MIDDRYGRDVLSGDWKNTAVSTPETVEAVLGLTVEHTVSEWCGAVVGYSGGYVELEDRLLKVRSFPLTDGFLIDGKPVILTVPSVSQTTNPGSGSRAKTASGSFAVAHERAKTALPSRIFVEGRHDAELVEKIWGDDLRVEGVVVEYIEGVDNLEDILTEFAPHRGRRAGVLVDHLVPGSKESRVAEKIMTGPHGKNVLIVGHPFVDVWQSVKPQRLGLDTWPVIPRTVEWKKGICAAFGWPHETQADIAHAWKRILGRVSSYSDLEPDILGRVEQLIDFVTEPE